MASTFEQLILEIITRDRASPALDRIGVSAGDAAGNVDTLQRRLTEVGNKSATARLALAGNKEAIAALDRIDAKLVSLDRRTANPDLKVEGAARAIAEISAVDAALDKIGKGGAGGGGSAGGAAAGLTGMLTPMTGLIAAGVALAPLVATLAVGLTGVGAAAYGVAKPIENAAKKAGGLQANLAALDPEQQQVALSLLALGKQYGAFEKALQPQILADFNQGIKLAGTLMHDVEPVAKGTASAVGSLVAGLDAEFKSATWTQFFSFMATTGVQDVRMLDTSLLNLVHTLPVIIQNIQPLTQTMLDMTTVISRLAALSADAGGGLSKTGAGAHQAAGPLGTVGSTINRLLLDLTPFSPDLRKVWDNLAGLATASGPASKGLVAATSGMQHFQQVTIGTVPAVTGLVDKTITAVTPMGHLGKAASVTSMTIQETGRNAYLAIDPLSHLGKVADVLVGTQKGLASTGRSAAGAADAVAAAWRPMLSGTRLVTAAVTALNASMTKLIGNLLTLQGSDLSWKQSMQAAEAQLRSNSAGLEGNSKNALANKQAVLASTQAAISFAQQELTTGRDINGASRTVQAQIRFLQSLHDKSTFVRSELAALRAEEAKLQAQRVNQQIQVNGIGRWSIAGPGGRFQSGKPIATGGLIRGGIPGKDSVPVLAMPGELVVPTHMVAAGVVDHLRGRLPGFASGGIVPSYRGAVGGLEPWVKHNDAATIRLIDLAVVKATVRAAQAAASGGAARGSGGPASGAVRALQAYAASLFGQYGWAPNVQLPPLIALWNGESGWNPMARNPSSGAFGIPQALPPGKMGALAASGNAAAQIRWGEGYIHGVYGTPAEAYGMWLSRSPHWYGSGGSDIFTHPTLIGVGERGPERVTVTPVGGAGDTAVLAALARIEKLLAAAPARTGDAVGGALHGAARGAYYSGRYSPR